MGVHHETILPMSSVSLGRTVAAALLVEIGARVQNGCTSGHGICGISRLSVRSAAAVGKFKFDNAFCSLEMLSLWISFVI